MVFLCIEFAEASGTYLAVLKVTNLVFVVIFTLESLLKLIGLGPVYFFTQVNNVFDFGIVVSSLLGANEDWLPINITALRLIRVLRLLRLLNASSSI